MTHPSRVGSYAAALVLVATVMAGGGEERARAVVAATAPLALVDVHLIDLHRGVVRPETTVLVQGGQISAVGPVAEVAVPENAEVVSGKGRFLIPGLWDLHVHTLWDESLADTFLPLFVAHGVTGVRDMGGREDLAADWPVRIEAGELFGPRIVAAGPILDGDPPLHPEVSVAIDGPEAARREVRRLAAAGFPFVKVYTLLSRPSYFAIADEARRLDLPFAGHPSGQVSPIEAAEAGQRSIEHLAHGQPESGRIDLSCVDRDGCTDLLRAFVRHRTWQVPTLVILRAKAYAEEDRYADDPRRRYVPAMVRADFEASRRRRLEEGTPEIVRARREDWRRNSLLVGQMAAAGVPIGAGTDTGVLFSLPGFSLHDELELLVEAGMTPLAALRSATVSAARLLRKEGETGVVEVGAAADLVLLDENPLEAISATRAISAVVRAGRHYDRAALDRWLATVERAAAP